MTTMYTKADLALIGGMKKDRLREACRAAGIKSYSKMTTDQMREAVRQHMGRALVAHAAPVMETAFKPIKRSKLKDDTPVVKQPREERNKVKRPLDPNSRCGQVWAKCDELHKAGKLDSKTLLAWSDEQGMNRNNTSIELSQWRKFHGLGIKEVKAA
jgi:hypothetical protein